MEGRSQRSQDRRSGLKQRPEGRENSSLQESLADAVACVDYTYRETPAMKGSAALWIFALFSFPLSAQCTLPGIPSLGTIDSTFVGYTTQNGPGWTGADGTYSLLLPDGTNLWMWSDSYIGTVNPTTRLRSSDLFSAHNSLTILNQSTGSWTTVGYPPSTTSYFAPKNKNDWFWVGGGYLVPSGSSFQIKIMLMEWTGAFKLVGHS